MCPGLGIIPLTGFFPWAPGIPSRTGGPSLQLEPCGEFPSPAHLLPLTHTPWGTSPPGLGAASFAPPTPHPSASAQRYCFSFLSGSHPLQLTSLKPTVPVLSWETQPRDPLGNHTDVYLQKRSSLHTCAHTHTPFSHLSFSNKLPCSHQ